MNTQREGEWQHENETEVIIGSDDAGDGCEHDPGVWGDAAVWAGQGYGGKPFGVDIPVDNKTKCPRYNVVQFLYRLSK